MGNCPGGELSWWGFVLVGICPGGGELSSGESSCYFMKLVITDNLSFTDYYHGNSQ